MSAAEVLCHCKRSAAIYAGQPSPRIHGTLPCASLTRLFRPSNDKPHYGALKHTLPETGTEYSPLTWSLPM